jgi:hypothetical protein
MRPATKKAGWHLYRLQKLISMLARRRDVTSQEAKRLIRELREHATDLIQTANNDLEYVSYRDHGGTIDFTGWWLEKTGHLQKRVEAAAKISRFLAKHPGVKGNGVRRGDFRGEVAHAQRYAETVEDMLNEGLTLEGGPRRQ